MHLSFTGNWRQILRSQRGDTIIEVLIATAIISLVLTTAYAAANRNVRVTRDTMEHSQALQLVQAQIENLRTVSPPAAGGCYDASGNPVGSSNCVFKGDGTANPGSAVQPAYTLSISAPDSNGVRKVSAIWDSVLGTTDHINIYYGPQG